MKVAITKFSHWVFNNFDSLDDLQDFCAMLFFVIFGQIPIFTFLHKYGLNTDYGFFAVGGQCCIYIAKKLYPNWFPKQPEYSIGSWLSRFFGNCVLAWTFGVFATEYFSKYVGEYNLQIATIALGVGAFYEMILKPLVKYAYKFSKPDRESN